MKPPPPITTFASPPRGGLAVYIIASFPLTRDILSAALAGIDGVRLKGAAADVSASLAAVRGDRPDIYLIDLLPSAAVCLDSVVLLKQRVPEAKIVLLDDVMRGSHIEKANRAGALGYITRQHTLGMVADVLWQVSLDGCEFLSPDILSPATVASGKHNPGAGLLDGLTPREKQVLRLLARGCTVRRCAAILKLSESTVDNHKSRMMSKLGVHKTVELTRLAIRAGLTEG